MFAPLGQLYGSVARARRHWYAAHDDARRRLAHPVVSVGNLSVGGVGKTPLVIAVVSLLREAGERPAILSRGYGRRSPAAGVLVVSDGETELTDVRQAGDEPFMLARACRGTPVLVSAERYAAGRLAETRLACTVHVLDDGFQHLGLHRDVDLLVVAGKDLEVPHPLPHGRLREPLEAARAADALLVDLADSVPPDDAARALGVPVAFSVERTLRSPRGVTGAPRSFPSGPVLAVAGIGNPNRFFDDLRACGVALAGTRTFADHHWYTRRDVAGVQEEARRLGAQAILTTEKDIVRLEALTGAASSSPALAGTDVPICWVPLEATVDPSFRPWLLERLAEARRSS